MKWTNINYLKMHSRILDDCEDALLEQYGTAAENLVLTYTRRTYEDIIETYGEVPAELYVAVQLLVDNMYQNRSIATMHNMSIVPYSFDFIIKPFMRLADSTNDVNNRYGCKNL